MKKTVLALFVMTALLGVVIAADDDVKKDLQLLAGTWEFVSQTKNGEATPKEKFEGMSTIITAEGKWEIKQNDKVLLSGTVKLDPSKSPKAADWTVTTEGDAKGTTAKGIYKIDKDSFEHCWSIEDRPTKFESKEDSKIVYAVFKRAKK